MLNDTFDGVFTTFKNMKRIQSNSSFYLVLFDQLINLGVG